MQENSLKHLFVEELKDIYNAENQLVKALPKMAKAASSEELRSAFEEHLEQTKGHVARLDQIFKSLGESSKGKKCKGMEGLVKEGAEMIDEELGSDELDAGLISAAQRVEHYEIAAYGTVRTYAGILGDQESESLLSQTLQEEKETDEKLTEIAGDINIQAAEQGEQRETESEEESEEETVSSRKNSGRSKTARASN